MAPLWIGLACLSVLVMAGGGYWYASHPASAPDATATANTDSASPAATATPAASGTVAAQAANGFDPNQRAALERAYLAHRDAAIARITKLNNPGSEGNPPDNSPSPADAADKQALASRNR